MTAVEMAEPSAGNTEGSPTHNDDNDSIETKSITPGAAASADKATDGGWVVGSRVLKTTADPLPKFRRLLVEIGIEEYERVTVCHAPQPKPESKDEKKFTATLGAAKDAPGLAAPFVGREHVWFGVNPLRPDLKFGKGTADDVARITSLYSDWDVKPGGLASTDECRTAIDMVSAALGNRQPVALVLTGSGGIHSYHRLAPYPPEDHPRAVRDLRAYGMLAKAVAVELGGSVDTVQNPDRIMRAPGSVNMKPGCGEVVVEFWDDHNPDVKRDEITLDDLESCLLEAGIRLDEPGDVGYQKAADDDVVRMVDCPESGTCAYVASIAKGWKKDVPKKNRHNWVLNQLIRACEFRRLGHISREDFVVAVAILKERFLFLHANGLGGPVQVVGKYEFAGCVAWAHSRVEEATEEYLLADVKHDTCSFYKDNGTAAGGDGSPAFGPPVTDDGLFERSPELAHIRLAALRGMAAPEAVLFTVLARIGQTIPPHVCTPAFIGGWGGSLNSLTALVGRSASGKGAAFSVAEACVRLPVSIHTTTVGSGEGLAKKYVRWDAKAKAYVRVRSAVLFTASEIKGLKALMERNGATLEDQLLKMYSGEQLGYAYADDTKANEVEAHTYRGGLVTGVQVANASILFGMAESGMPQRFEWARVEDPDITRAAQGPQPSPLVLPDMDWSLSSDSLIPWREFPMVDEVGEEVALTREQNMQGLVAELDGHGMFTRVKLAARVAVLHGRQEVTSWDWEISGLLKARSDRARDWARSELGRIAQGSRDFENMLRGQEAVAVRETVHAAAVKGARNAVRSKLSRAGGATRRALKDTCGSQYRDGLSEALEALLANGEVVKDGSEYRLKESS